MTNFNFIGLEHNPRFSAWTGLKVLQGLYLSNSLLTTNYNFESFLQKSDILLTLAEEKTAITPNVKAKFDEL